MCIFAVGPEADAQIASSWTLARKGRASTAACASPTKPAYLTIADAESTLGVGIARNELLWIPAREILVSMEEFVSPTKPENITSADAKAILKVRLLSGIKVKHQMADFLPV